MTYTTYISKKSFDSLEKALTWFNTSYDYAISEGYTVKRVGDYELLIFNHHTQDNHRIKMK